MVHARPCVTVCQTLPSIIFELLVSPKNVNATIYSVYGEEIVDSPTPNTRPEEGKRRALFIDKQKMHTAQAHGTDSEHAHRNWFVFYCTMFLRPCDLVVSYPTKMKLPTKWRVFVVRKNTVRIPTLRTYDVDEEDAKHQQHCCVRHYALHLHAHAETLSCPQPT